MSSSHCLNDNSFGPAVQGCRGDFDFTQKFERIVLTIVPASVFIACALTRVFILHQKRRIVNGSCIKYIKLVSWGIYASLQLCTLVLLVTGNRTSNHDLNLVAAGLVLVAALTSVPLSYYEHGNAVKPSALIGGFLALTTLFDIAQSRTAWLTIFSARHVSIASLASASLALKVVLMCLEAIPKTRWMNWDPKEHSPEESMNMFSHGAWAWVNRLLLRGNRRILDIDSLYPLDTRMAAAKLHMELDKKMRIENCRNDPKFGLLKDLFRTLGGQYLLPVAPRLAFSAFKFCQPLLINATLKYLSQDEETENKNIGYGLIGAAALVYSMIAVCKGFYSYWNIKSLYQTRGCLSAAIYRKTVTAKLTAADDSAALTLMSTDIERIILGGEFVHEVWASTLEVAIGLWLLEEQIGVAFLAPIVIILCCSFVTFGVSSLLGKRQKAWMERIQHRVGLTTAAIANMKLFKLSGMAATVTERIQALRVVEIEVGKRMRWLTILCAAAGFLPFALGPTLTFAVTARGLEISTIFTSIAYIMLVSEPLLVLFQVYPNIIAALTCLQRIQRFLVSEPRIDYRQFAESVDEKKTSSGPVHGQSAFNLEGACAGWSPDTFTLKDISVSIPAAELTLIVGPVACGKSTLCKTLLGEIPNFKGKISARFSRQGIAYCQQVPFLYNASLKSNIIGQCDFDQKKFDNVIHATLLDIDIATLPQGSDTNIGSEGIMLSGGQRQRVSVARALYSASNILIFDDILSGLDTDTDSELFRRVFGAHGILRERGATAIICTHSVSHLPEADHIIALGHDGKVVEQGTFMDLSNNQSYIQSLGIQKPGSSVSTTGTTSFSKPTLERLPPKQETAAAALRDKSRQNGDWSVYAYWFGSIHPLATIGLVVGGLVHGFLEAFSTIWLRYWSENTFHKGNGFYIGILGLLRVADVVVIGEVLIIVMIVMITFAGSNLHYAAIRTVASAPLGFFTSTDNGVITNLFSQDMTLIDGALLFALTNFCLNLPEVIGSAAVIAAASPYLAAGYPFLAAILYFIQSFYLRTSRQMRLLDLEAKSPLYTNFIDTMKGIATIRAYDWQSQLVEKNDQLLDTSQRPAYLLAMIQEWLALVMQLVVAVLAVILFTLATQLKASAGFTGASLITLLNLGLVLFMLVRSYTQLETCLGAVSRLRTFSTTVKPEDQPGEDVVPPLSWPSQGRIELRDVSASYDTSPGTSGAISEDGTDKKDESCVLRNVNLSVSPGQKVALCGRTGSGKSSLILLLARLLDPLATCADNIHIDGLSLRSIQRKALRERLIAIPQDAVFLPDGSTIRNNIDPYEGASPEECRAVLKVVGLDGFVDDRGGLDAGMSSDDLSAGQKQLFSLGRAILRKRVRDRALDNNVSGGILLLDEVSSNVDKVTDRKMQEIIKVEFATYTILMVSHRLQMVVDYFDRVVVLDQGAVVESGAPKELIETPGSRFAELWAIGSLGNASSGSSGIEE